MKTKHLKMVLSFLLLAGTVPFFNNFQFFSWKKESILSLDSVHEFSRIGHAKELLGDQHYNLSYAAQSELDQSLNSRIYAQVHKALPVAYKMKARLITQTLIRESARHKMDPVFLMAVIKTESRFNPQARGLYGEIGLMQLKPDTAQWIAQKFGISYGGPEALLNPQVNIRLGVAYMNMLRTKFDNQAGHYISAYNMGPLNVRRLLAQNIKPQEYASRVMSNYSKLYGRLAAKNELLVASN